MKFKEYQISFFDILSFDGDFNLNMSDSGGNVVTEGLGGGYSGE